MSRNQLSALLSSDGFTPASVASMASVCEQWFIAAPGVESLLLRSILGELASRWDDQQGVPAGEIARFEIAFLPALEQFTALPDNASSDAILAALEALALGFHAARP